MRQELCQGWLRFGVWKSQGVEREEIESAGLEQLAWKAQEDAEDPLEVVEAQETKRGRPEGVGVEEWA